MMMMVATMHDDDGDGNDDKDGDHYYEGDGQIKFPSCGSIIDKIPLYH